MEEHVPYGSAESARQSVGADAPAGSAFLAQEPMAAYQPGFLSRIRQGLPGAYLGQLQTRLGASQAELAELLHLSVKTLHRYADEHHLDTPTSERILLLEDLFRFGQEVLGSQAHFTAWLRRPNRTLGGVAPLEVLNSFTGIVAVKDQLGRIQHGVYA